MKHNYPALFSEAREQSALLGVDLQENSYENIGIFLDFLEKGSSRVNLVGPSEVPRLWTRHVLESLAYIPYLSGENIIDIGTGAGFPGMVLALCGFRVTMIESRRKRCAFLESFARNCGVSCRIINSRIEEAGPFPAGSIFTSRAVKGPEEMKELIFPAAAGRYTLVTRVAEKSETCSNTIISEELPIPPLDRKGFILQYRHP